MSKWSYGTHKHQAGLLAAIEPALWPVLVQRDPSIHFQQIEEVTVQVDNEINVISEVH